MSDFSDSPSDPNRTPSTGERGETNPLSPENLAPGAKEGADSTRQPPFSSSQPTHIDSSQFIHNERAIAFLSLLLDQKILTEDQILEALPTPREIKESGPFGLEQHFLKARLLPADQYLNIQNILNEKALICSRCEKETYHLEESLEDPLCTSCLVQEKGEESSRAITSARARRLEILETFLSRKNHGLVGQIWEGYEILEELGRGGMGVVYKARQIDLHRIVALKVIKEGDQANSRRIQRFLREARSLASLRHPHIVNIFEINSREGQYYFTMDYIEGQSLEDLIREGELTAPQAVKILRDVARAVSYAHSQGIVHRDLKPPNILINQDGQPVVMDFGLAKLLEDKAEKLTRTGAVVGTPLYMAPEQITSEFGKIDEQTDVYALGVILYKMLTGVSPFAAKSHGGTYNKILHEEAPDIRTYSPFLSVDLDTICKKAMEKEKNQRFSSAEALAEDLDRYLKDQPIQARRITLLERGWRKISRHPLPSLAVTLVFLTLIGLGYFEMTAPGTLLIPSLSGEEKVFVNGEEVNNSLQAGRLKLVLDRGQNKIRIEKKGHHPFEKTIEVQAGGHHLLTPQLVRKKGTLSLTSHPATASVTLIPEKGEKLTLSAPLSRLQLPTGKYRLLVSEENHLPQSKKIEIGREEEKTLYFSLSPMIKGRFESIFPSPELLALADVNGDGYRDLILKDGPHIKAHNLQREEKLWDFREHILHRERALQSLPILQKFNLGEAVETKAVNCQSHTLFHLLKTKATHYLFTQNFHGTKCFDSRGVFQKKYFYPLHHVIFRKGVPHLYFFRIKFRKETVKIPGSGGKAAKKVLKRRPYRFSLAAVKFTGPGKNRYLWKHHFRRRKLAGLLEKKITLPSEKKPLWMVKKGFFLALDPDHGKVLTYYRTPSPISPKDVIKKDLNGDGVKDLAFLTDRGLECLSGRSGKKLLSLNLHVHNQSKLILAPSEGEKPRRFVAFDPHLRLTAWDLEGKVLWKFSKHRPARAQNISAAHIDGDGHLDFVIYGKKKLFAISGKEGRLISSFHAPQTIKGPLLLGDVDNDRWIEALVSTGQQILILQLYQAPHNWSHPLSPQSIYLKGNSREIKILENKNLVTFSTVKGRKTNQTSYLGDKDTYLLPLSSEKINSPLLIARDRRLCLLDKKGKALWTSPFQIHSSFERKKITPERLLKADYSPPGEVKSRGLPLYIFPWKIPSKKAGISILTPGKNGQNLEFISLSAESGQVLKKIVMADYNFPYFLKYPPHLFRYKSQTYFLLPHPRRYLQKFDFQKMKFSTWKKRIVRPYYARKIEILHGKGDGKREILHYNKRILYLRKEKSPRNKWFIPFSHILSRNYSYREAQLTGPTSRQVKVVALSEKKKALLIAENYLKINQKAINLTLIAPYTGKILWNYFGRDESLRDLRVIDLDSDGREEILLASDSKIEILSGRRGYLLWSLPLSSAKILDIFPRQGHRPPALLVQTSTRLHYCPLVSGQKKMSLTARRGTFFTSPRKGKKTFPPPLFQSRKDKIDFYTDLAQFYPSHQFRATSQALEGKLAQLAKLEGKYPEETTLKIIAVKILIQLGRAREARPILEKLQLKIPNNPSLYEYFARIYFQTKNYFKAYYFIHMALRIRDKKHPLSSQRFHQLRKVKNQILKALAKRAERNQGLKKGKTPFSDSKALFQKAESLLRIASKSRSSLPLRSLEYYQRAQKSFQKAGTLPHSKVKRKVLLEKMKKFESRILQALIKKSRKELSATRYYLQKKSDMARLKLKKARKLLEGARQLPGKEGVKREVAREIKALERKLKEK